ncbi:hypothetical protein ANANG_G00273980 [Anguilla anguilla]|uniref:Ashwin n=1 Tax=Anguilla anguilla TaxID=7936 RepID=A0A9D3LMC6_ANGAN|nr:hypothetical protein ANANG_G00273980 [Anguilla anguilla]
MADYSTGRQGKDRSTRNDASNTDLLLHPELLSRDFIQLVLHERKIGTGERSEASQDRLTDLYLQHVIPYRSGTSPTAAGAGGWGGTGHAPRRATPTEAHTGEAEESLTGFSSSGGENARKRPLIVFDGSSTRTGSVKLKKPESGSGADRLKPPPSGNLANPIRKLCGPLQPGRDPASPGGTNRSPGEREDGVAHIAAPAVATATVAAGNSRHGNGRHGSGPSEAASSSRAGVRQLGRAQVPGGEEEDSACDVAMILLPPRCPWGTLRTCHSSAESRGLIRQSRTAPWETPAQAFLQNLPTTVTLETAPWNLQVHLHRGEQTDFSRIFLM